MQLLLLTPIEEGGFGRSIEDIMPYLVKAKENSNIFLVLIHYKLTASRSRLFDVIRDLLEAIRTHFKDIEFLDRIIISLASGFVEKLLAEKLGKISDADHIAAGQIEQIAAFLEAMQPGNAITKLAFAYKQNQSFDSAFDSFKQVYLNQQAKKKTDAGYELALMIHQGYGPIDPALDASCSSQPELTEDQKKAIMGYEYIHGNNNLKACELRKKLNQALCYQGIPKSLNKAVWQPSMVQAFNNYYIGQQKYPMLGDNVFHDSFMQSIENITSSRELKRRRTGEYNAGFLADKSQEKTIIDLASPSLLPIEEEVAATSSLLPFAALD